MGEAKWKQGLVVLTVQTYCPPRNIGSTLFPFLFFWEKRTVPTTLRKRFYSFQINVVSVFHMSFKQSNYTQVTLYFNRLYVYKPNDMAILLQYFNIGIATEWTYLGEP